MRNKVHSITESRIHGDMYVRFGGRFGETCGSNAVRRSEPSLQIKYLIILVYIINSYTIFFILILLSCIICKYSINMI